MQNQEHPFISRNWNVRKVRTTGHSFYTASFLHVHLVFERNMGNCFAAIRDSVFFGACHVVHENIPETKEEIANIITNAWTNCYWTIKNCYKLCIQFVYTPKEKPEANKNIMPVDQAFFSEHEMMLTPLGRSYLVLTPPRDDAQRVQTSHPGNVEKPRLKNQWFVS